MCLIFVLTLFSDDYSRADSLSSIINYYLISAMILFKISSEKMQSEIIQLIKIMQSKLKVINTEI